MTVHAVAEHVLAFVLCWYKNLIYLDGFMKAHGDESGLDYTGSELAGKTIGLATLGNGLPRFVGPLACRCWDTAEACKKLPVSSARGHGVYGKGSRVGCGINAITVEGYTMCGIALRLPYICTHMR